MLKVTVELWPGGRESGSRVLATAKIGRVKNGALADYKVELLEDVQGEIATATLHDYPRYASTIWDLVARTVAVALTGKEELPPRPQQLDVPVRISGNTPYVRFREIPEPARSLFKKRMAFSTRPLIDEDPEPMECAYAWDWRDFLDGGR
ncbi:hypothetical protein [Paraburkholderia domus]|uniref:hypothetical protein n=1 Tax=Paraburkholderia domus TaxID=2793075 RepID=UPI00191375E5|nr:hypothetical protein [Paraburkholderia domus]MBK5052352.1 hypothetical protein [Burkholderia sp. R-70006]MBK5185909.1 hypothetical protein [Burkholderia sp. R-69749]CAE6807602.1 hypothetical protein R70006_05606 [Paraburkholderia domus]CAE6897145.1 hypothetical protein R69749_07941 [Paraburkholderia domus]